MRDEQLTDDERKLMALFDRVSLSPMVLQRAVVRAQEKRGWRGIVDRTVPARPVARRHLVAALALAVSVGGVGAVAGAHQLTGSRSHGGAAASPTSAASPQAIPTSPPPAFPHDATDYAVMLIGLGGPSGCQNSVGQAHAGGAAPQPGEPMSVIPYATWLEKSPNGCGPMPPSQITPGTYVMDLDDCNQHTGTTVTVIVGQDGKPKVTRVAAASYGMALAHHAQCLPPAATTPPATTPP
jgi:hypothetical protein